MGLQVWLASVPGVIVAGLLSYLNQRRLQRVSQETDRRFDHYFEFIDLLNQHNRQMWERLYQRLPTSTPYPPALSNEAEIARRVTILASPRLQVALSRMGEAIVEWREADERRLDAEPRRLVIDSDLFGEIWHTPADNFIRAGEGADYALQDLCEAVRAELTPRNRAWRRYSQAI